MSNVIASIGPADDGRRMSLDDFESAEGEPGHLYELSRGVVSVIDVPHRKHLAQVDTIRQDLSEYRAARRDRIHTIAGGGECRIPVAGLESDRHPDLALYLNAPPVDEDDYWAQWIPGIVIEVVSPSSVYRHYFEKREEYLQFGVQEYWIVDADKREVLVLRRSRGRWIERTIHPGEKYRTRLLPGFEFDCARAFEAADAA